jgi:hypothetical protein
LFTYKQLGVALALLLEGLVTGGEPTGGGGESATGNEGGHCGSIGEVERGVFLRLLGDFWGLLVVGD